MPDYLPKELVNLIYSYDDGFYRRAETFLIGNKNQYTILDKLKSIDVSTIPNIITSLGDYLILEYEEETGKIIPSIRGTTYKPISISALTHPQFLLFLGSYLLLHPTSLWALAFYFTHCKKAPNKNSMEESLRDWSYTLKFAPNSKRIYARGFNFNLYQMMESNGPTRYSA